VPAPRKYDPETMARAVRMYQDRISEHGESKLTARSTVGELLGINPATLRNWVEREEIDTGVRPGARGAISSPELPEGLDAFVHFSAIEAEGFRAFEQGDRVDFDYVPAQQDSFRFVATRARRI
jgi:CspA family cold shock protein